MSEVTVNSLFSWFIILFSHSIVLTVKLNPVYICCLTYIEWKKICEFTEYTSDITKSYLLYIWRQNNQIYYQWFQIFIYFNLWIGSKFCITLQTLPIAFDKQILLFDKKKVGQRGHWLKGWTTEDCNYEINTRTDLSVLSVYNSWGRITKIIIKIMDQPIR